MHMHMGASPHRRPTAHLFVHDGSIFSGQHTYTHKHTCNTYTHACVHACMRTSNAAQFFFHGGKILSGQRARQDNADEAKQHVPTREELKLASEEVEQQMRRGPDRRRRKAPPNKPEHARSAPALKPPTKTVRTPGGGGAVGTSCDGVVGSSSPPHTIEGAMRGRNTSTAGGSSSPAGAGEQSMGSRAAPS